MMNEQIKERLNNLYEKQNMLHHHIIFIGNEIYDVCEQNTVDYIMASQIEGVTIRSAGVVVLKEGMFNQKIS